MTTKFRAGQDTDAWCGNRKCRMMLAHVIHAVAATGRPAKVECKTCGAVHGYRPEPPGTGAAKAKKTTSARQTPEKIFDALIDGKDISSPIRYTIKEEFEKDAVIDHKKFGIGVVTQLLTDQKIEVTFREGTKILIHGR